MKVLILLLLSYISTILTDKLLFAFSFTRNGARTPLHLSQSKKDIFGEQWFGEAELTKVGKRQQYLLGYYLHLRYMQYKLLLSEIYEPREVYFSSTEFNRTLQSAYAQIHGIYQKGVLLNEKQKKNAIPPNTLINYSKEKEALGDYSLPNNMMIAPVHTFYEKEHAFELQREENCKGIKEYTKSKHNEKVVKDLREEIVNSFGEGLIKLIKTEDGSTVDKETLKSNVTLFNEVIDSFLSEYINEYEAMMKKFTDAGIDIETLYNKALEYNKLLAFGSFYIKEYSNSTLKEEEKTIAKIASTSTSQMLLNWMKMRMDYNKKGDDAKKSYEAPKYVDYIAIHSSLDVFNLFINEALSLSSFSPSSFSSSALVELFLNEESKEYYVNYTIDDKEITKIKYSDFESSIQRAMKTSNEINAYCGIQENKAQSFNYFILSSIGSGLLFVGLLVFVVIYAFNRNKHSYEILEKSTLNQ